MAHRVNIMLDDFAWNILQELPKGERSKIVNTAIVEWARARKRANAAQRMDALRAQLPEVSTDEIVAWLRSDRGRAD